MTRQYASLRRQVAALHADRSRDKRFLELLAGSSPAESPEEWADRAAMTWCAEPGVSAARITWHDTEDPVASGRRTPNDAPDPSRPQEQTSPPHPGEPPRPASLVLPLCSEGCTRASIELWCPAESTATDVPLVNSTIRGAWEAWAGLLADRTRLAGRLRAVVGSLRQQVEGAEERLRKGKLEALGEFAAGAGHELNNPLAVVVGRAQLLLARADDPEVVRSLRIILGQAQRAHRILRDLMFVARPPAPRPRACRPSELLATLLRDFERECSTRGVRLVTELEEAPSSSWTDPEAMRHLAEILLRNALQATPSGGRIHVRSTLKNDELIWSVSDTGKGINAGEAAHLFDPFYCGRQAGRGLGLGLPRASKIVELAGGKLRWTSSPGHETTFQVHLPLNLPSPPEQSAPNPSISQTTIPHVSGLPKS